MPILHHVTLNVYITVRVKAACTFSSTPLHIGHTVAAQRGGEDRASVNLKTPPFSHLDLLRRDLRLHKVVLCQSTKVCAAGLAQMLEKQKDKICLGGMQYIQVGSVLSGFVVIALIGQGDTFCGGTRKELSNVVHRKDGLFVGFHLLNGFLKSSHAKGILCSENLKNVCGGLGSKLNCKGFPFFEGCLFTRCMSGNIRRWCQLFPSSLLLLIIAALVASFASLECLRSIQAIMITNNVNNE